MVSRTPAKPAYGIHGGKRDDFIPWGQTPWSPWRMQWKIRTPRYINMIGTAPARGLTASIDHIALRVLERAE